MTYTILRALPLSAALLLAACNTQPETITAGPDDSDVNTSAAPVKLPPAMLASKSYRCKDNTLVYVDWFNDNMTANLHLKEKAASPVNLSAPSAGATYAGGGYELTGTAEAKSVTLKKGGASQACDG
jgi:hypothetical protein